MEAIMNLLLLAVLFVAGFLNLLFYFPTKRFSSWFLSLKPHFKSPTSSSAAVAAAAVNPSPAAMDDGLKRVFATFDKDSDGFITKKELMESLRSMRMAVTEGEAEEMLRGVDENGDGFIDFEEFCVLGEKLIHVKKQIEIEDDDEEEEEDEEEELREAFGVFDKDKDGVISVEELGLVLCSLGLNEGNKLENCKQMIEKVDLDGDGMVNFDEFKRMMRGGGLLLANS